MHSTRTTIASDRAGRRPGRARTGVLGVLGVLTLATALTACSGSETIEDPATGAAPSTPPSSAPWSEGPDGERVFTATDYTYRLELVCFCPLTGPVDVAVADGEVSEAVIRKGADKGEPAPEFYRLTISDILERAGEPDVDEAEVTWPDSSDHPTQVALDPIERAIDDEITYLITDLRLAD